MSDIELNPFKSAEFEKQQKKQSSENISKWYLLLLIFPFLFVISIFVLLLGDKYPLLNFQPKCPANWTRLNRTMGSWCVQVFAGKMNLSMAEKTCANQSAVISSVESPKELLIFSTMAAFSHKEYVFIGARRTKQCVGSTINDVCTKNTSFEWTDGFTKGVDGFRWEDTQPDNDQGDQNCVVLGVRTSLLDDERASAERGGVVCGTKPR